MCAAVTPSRPLGQQGLPRRRPGDPSRTPLPGWRGAASGQLRAAIPMSRELFHMSTSLRVKLKQLDPNPFRRLCRYKNDADRNEFLRQSLRKIDWLKVPVRKVGQRYQIGFGKERLDLLRE